ncbi:MAG: hypothetical protein ABIK09_18285 [Pseudomonadota bacterium]
MSDRIIIADPSRTVRTLVRLAFQDRAGGLLEVADPGGLAEALSEPGTRVLIVDETWVDAPELREALASVGAILVLGGGTCRGVPWAEALGVDAARVASTTKPVSRASVREAADRISTVGGPATAAGLRALVAEEVSRAIGDEIGRVVWRIVPELAERLIKEELERLLKDDGEDEL